MVDECVGRVVAVSSPCAWCPCGTCRSQSRRFAGTRHEGFAPWHSPSCPRTSGSEHLHPLLGSDVRRMRGDGHRHLHAHRLRDEDAAGLSRRARRRGGDDLFGNSVASLTDILFSGVLHRFPGLRLMYAEAQIGWVPYVLERADDVWDTHRGWSNSQRDCPEPPPPTTGGVRSTAASSRMPSACRCWMTSAWTTLCSRPTTPIRTVPAVLRQEAARQFGHLDQISIDKIARGNGIRLFGLDHLVGA